MLQFMWGATTMASLVACVFFLRFYRDSHDRLFALFGAAFLVLAVHWALLGVVPMESEHRPLAYLVRLFAFGLIFLGIVDKNRRPH